MKILDKKEAFGWMSPLPYVLVTSLDSNENPNVLGVAWITRTSWEPFLILISIDHSRYSHDGIKLHQEFVINYPSKSQKDIAWLAGTTSGKNVDKIKEGNIELIDSMMVKPPTIKGVTVAFECRIVSEHITGDHTIFVGEVVAARGNPENDSTLFCNNKYQIVAMDSSGHIKN